VVAAAVAPWKEAFPKARWVPEANWHVTIKFLGSTWPRLEEWVFDAVERVADQQGPIRTRVMGLGAFPAPARASVLWAGLDDDLDRLAGLAEELDGSLSREFAPETRPFRPHLTVARSRPPIRLPEAFATTELRTKPFTIDRLVVFRSHLRRPAPLYEPLRTFPLKR